MTTPTPRTDATMQHLSHRSRFNDDLPSHWDEIVSADFARVLERECERLRAALVELVACKDLKIRIDRSNHAAIIEEYQRRDPLAWAKARTALEAK